MPPIAAHYKCAACGKEKTVELSDGTGPYNILEDVGEAHTLGSDSSRVSVKVTVGRDFKFKHTLFTPAHMGIRPSATSPHWCDDDTCGIMYLQKITQSTAGTKV